MKFLLQTIAKEPTDSRDVEVTCLSAYDRRVRITTVQK